MLNEIGSDFVDAFVTAPSPGMVSAIVLNEYYSTQEDFIDALASALRVEYEAILKSASSCSSTARIWRVKDTTPTRTAH